MDSSDKDLKRMTHGTAFTVDFNSKQFIITNAHNADHARNAIEINGEWKELSPYRIVKNDEGVAMVDLAIFTCKEILPNSVRLVEPELFYIPSSFKDNEVAVHSGFITNGRINARVASGASGSPVLNSKLELVGIVWSGDRKLTPVGKDEKGNVKFKVEVNEVGSHFISANVLRDALDSKIATKEK